MCHLNSQGGGSGNNFLTYKQLVNSYPNINKTLLDKYFTDSGITKNENMFIPDDYIEEETSQNILTFKIKLTNTKYTSNKTFAPMGVSGKNNDVYIHLGSSYTDSPDTASNTFSIPINGGTGYSFVVSTGVPGYTMKINSLSGCWYVGSKGNGGGITEYPTQPTSTCNFIYICQFWTI